MELLTLNSRQPFQFSRPLSSGEYDARRSMEHEMDEILGLGSHLNASPPSSDLRPQDVFSWLPLAIETRRLLVRVIFRLIVEL